MTRPRRVDHTPPLLLVAAALPMLLVTLAVGGLLAEARWSTLVDDLTAPETLTALRLSLITSSVATGLVVCTGIPLAWLLAHLPEGRAAALRVVVLVPMVLPPVVGGIALLSAFGARGPIGSLLDDLAGVRLTYAPAGVVMAAWFVALPFFVVTLEAAIRGLDPRLDDVTATLGASPMRRLWSVVLPMVRPALAAGAVLAWARAIGEFGATITFAGNVEGRTQTLPLAAYAAFDVDRGAAVAISILLLVLSASILFALRGRWVARW